MGRQNKVLVVDDDEFALQSIAEVLEGESYQVVTAASGSEALALLKQDAFDLVLTDLKMPGVDGLEVLRRAREIAPQAVVLILTGYAALESAIETLREGAYDYLVKPCSNGELKLKIEKGLERVRLAEERQRAQEEMRGSEERLRTIFAASPDCVYLTDTEGNILDANPTLLELVGLSLEQMRKKNVLDFFTGDDPERLLQAAARLQAGEEVRGLETQARVATGEVRNYDISAIPLREKGTVTAILSVARDITERKRAEEALQESEEQFRLLFENASEGVMLFDTQGHILNANPTLMKLLPLPREEVVGHHFMDILPALDLEPAEVLASFQRIISGNPEGRALEWEIVSAEGTSMILAVRSSVIKKEGEIVGFSIFVDDVTERQRAEEELRQSYVKLQRALEGTINTLVSAIEIRDPYTAGHQRRGTQLACAIAREMGLSEEQIEGLRMAGLIHDIGKISVPAEVLSKPGPLTELEFGMIKTHTQVGHDLLNGMIDFPWPVAQIVLQHHERMDGSGYPQGLSGEEIMLEARILAVADVVEAMASHRPYRPARGLDKALEEVSRKRGILYDPKVVDACLKLFTEKGFTFE
jgi:PAS domain S-box-containing protein